VLPITLAECQKDNKNKYFAVSIRQDSDEESKMDPRRIDEISVDDLDAEAGFL
jgi:hypothetical protein